MTWLKVNEKHDNEAWLLIFMCAKEDLFDRELSREHSLRFSNDSRRSWANKGIAIAFYVNRNAQIIPFKSKCLFTLLFSSSSFPFSRHISSQRGRFFTANNLYSYLFTLRCHELRTGSRFFVFDGRCRCDYSFGETIGVDVFLLQKESLSLHMSQSLFFLRFSLSPFSPFQLLFDVKMLWNNHKNRRHCNNFFKVKRASEKENFFSLMHCNTRFSVF